MNLPGATIGIDLYAVSDNLRPPATLQVVALEIKGAMSDLSIFWDYVG